TAYYECYEPLSRITEYLALRLENTSSEEIARVKQPDTPTVSDMVNALRNLGQHTDGLFAQSWVAVIAWAD
ncbi:MAG TPA: hypothetical protein VHL11_02360, partial [Phototrophicaceae bacterium]|nr:hypothetical protein [Phototrophicaceae bacterium]